MDPYAYVVVIGGTNLDICGQSARQLIASDSNPGAIRISMGGVGRNIAHNLVLLGVPVQMLSAVGDDANANVLWDGCIDAGIDMSEVLIVEGHRTSSYLAITGPDGDMVLAVSDTGICDEISPAYLRQHLSQINHAAAVVIEANLPSASIAFLAEHCTAPLFADPVSVRKSEKLRPILPRLFALKPNRIEAAALTGIEITDSVSCNQALDRLLAAGVQQVYLSLGSKGMACATKNFRCTLPCFQTDLKNATGGGDAVMAALVWSYLRSNSPEVSVKLALAAGAIAVASDQTINPALSAQAVLQLANYQE